MGIYPLTFAQLVLGEPERLTAVANLSDGGIDLDVAIAGLYPGGATAALTASMTSHASVTATVATEVGCFDLPRPFYSPRADPVDVVRGSPKAPASGSSLTSRWSGWATRTRSSRCTGACAPEP